MPADCLRGADPDRVRAAIDAGDPLPGTAGFAGRVDDALVRDVLGREPLFVGARAADRTGTSDANPDAPSWSTDQGPGWPSWSFVRWDLESPRPFPAGSTLPLDAGPEVRPRRVWSLPDPAPSRDHERAVDALATAIGGLDVLDCPVAFSGGVDSALLAALGGGPLYVAGFPDSHDLEAARAAADAMGRADLRVVELSHGAIREAVPRVVRATGRTNAMDVSIAVPLSLVAERVAADGYDRLLVGQGADELFGGYAKVARASEDQRTDADTVRGATREVIGSLPDQLARDVPAIRAAGVEPVAPLLHDSVVAAALALPGPLLVDGDRRKVALRRVARRWVPESVAGRGKKALQYGTLVSRELDRLARRAGFKRRMDDHVSRFVESLVE